MKPFFKKNIYAFSLLVIALLVALASYEPGTILSGWDTLHPEFNFPEYFRRVIFGVWQEHQGLGALATQAHASELPRLLIYFLSSIVLPDSFLRYSYFLLSLVVGPLGVYFFIKNLIFESDNKSNHIASFSAGLFYLLNLGVLQHYYVPLEMFATHFATVPWLFLFAFKYLREKTNKSLLIFSLITFTSAPMAHTSTLWFVYLTALVLATLSYSLLRKNKGAIKSGLIVILVSALINSFWLLPNIYFILEGGQQVAESKIHSLFSDEAFLQSKSFGRVQDLLIFRNFLFNWGEYIGNNKFGPLLNEWIDHLTKPGVLFLGYFYSFIALLGIVFAFVKKEKVSLSLLLVLLPSVFFWLNVNPPAGFAFEFLQEKIPFFREAFRFPFTKFSILLIFCFSIYFALGVSFAISQIEKFRGKILLINIGIFLLVLSFLYYMYPAFKGNLISPSMKVNIPQEYFSMFEYFRNEPRERVAILPIHSFWGWVYNDWGYQGAGFLWFGLRQPLLDREFDRWSPKNEQYYREMSSAIYQKDPVFLSSVIEKYDITYLILDKSVLPAGVDERSLFYPEIEDLLTNQLKFEKYEFGDKLSVFKKNGRTYSSGYLLENPPSIWPATSSMYEDFAYSKYKDYITFQEKERNEINFPLRNLIDNQNRISFPLEISDDQLNLAVNESANDVNIIPISMVEDSVSFDLIAKKSGTNVELTLSPRFPIDSGASSSIPIISSIDSSENIILSINKAKFTTENLPQGIPLSLGKISIDTTRDNFITVYEDEKSPGLQPNFDSLQRFINPCEETKSPFYGVDFPDENSISLFGKDTRICFAIPLREVLSDISGLTDESGTLLVDIEYNYQGSQAPHLCITPQNSLRCQSSFPRRVYQEFNSQRISVLHEIRASDLDSFELKIILDSTLSPGKQVEALYSSLSFRLISPLYSITIPAETINESLAGNQHIKSVERLVIPFSGDEDLSQDITKFPVTGGDCPTDNPRGAPQNIKNIKKDTAGEFIRYSSTEGFYCDHFSYDSLSPNQAYLLSVTSRNLEGLPLRMCVNNTSTGRCELFVHLSRSKSFEQEFFLIPPRGQGEKFDVNISNFSIKGTPSINDLKSIYLIPFPYNLSYGLELKATAPNSGSSRSAVNISRINSSLYSVSLNQKVGVLVLDQSYDKGWKLYKTNSINALSKSFPFFFGKKAGKHVLVNNWANGWVLNQERGNFIIVYWPQYLEYLGFILSFGTLGFLVLKGLKSRSWV